jgi:hypothetical protein
MMAKDEQEKPAKGTSTEDASEEEEKPQGTWGTSSGGSSSDY